ncbi:hypothetical protein [Roseisolibacter sp. H3M3-2]|uniref:hypothetical protein n=1 Tax=Roseisolibacter sp. H3M3-2 TaxID=3031323 RepID=UPI0023DAA951|nr:hypothetical protein [Roseisolibacter sp. H3M3-2]MDF1501801.1 hypothetical protein [Roseisolibacter sp. H3M3-2]
MRAAQGAPPATAAQAWAAALGTADSLVAADPANVTPEVLFLRAYAALSVAEHRLRAAGVDTTCGLARRAAAAADTAEVSLPKSIRFSTRWIDSLYARLNLAAPQAHRLVRARCG